MAVPARYHCPGCGALATHDRPAAITDKSVTPFPAVGWRYADPVDDIESADGVRLVCGEQTDVAGCGRPFYVHYVRFDAGVEIDAMPEPASDGPRVGPRTPDSWRPADHA